MAILVCSSSARKASAGGTSFKRPKEEEQQQKHAERQASRRAGSPTRRVSRLCFSGGLAFSHQTTFPPCSVSFLCSPNQQPVHAMAACPCTAMFRLGPRQCAQRGRQKVQRRDGCIMSGVPAGRTAREPWAVLVSSDSSELSKFSITSKSH